MKIEKLTYIEFLQLPEAERIEFQEKCLCLQPLPVDCQEWKWGDVKFCQDILSDSPTYKDLIDIVKRVSNLNENKEAHNVLNMANSIRKSIEKISEIEKNALSGELTPKEIAAQEQVGGFAVFGTLPQTLSLVGVIAPSIKEVNECEWSLCFNTLVYLHRQNEFQKILFKQ